MSHSHLSLTGHSSSDQLPHTALQPPRQFALKTHLKATVATARADIPLLACCFISGLCDSSAYNAYSCFVSMQTGNTIFLALGASNQPRDKPYGWLKSLVSIVVFALGCLVFSFTRYCRPLSRGTLAVSFFLQSMCIVIAAIVIETGAVRSLSYDNAGARNNTVDFKDLIPLVFLAFQAGGQMVSSRLLGINEIPTTVLTSVYCDLSSDPKILKRDNLKRNRRFGAITCIISGGIAGGWISRSDGGLAAALWLAAGIKLIVALGWLFWWQDEGTTQE